jgi:hypothetical protein
MQTVARRWFAISPKKSATPLNAASYASYGLPECARDAKLQTAKRRSVFERYTEKARRVIFFARYEASEFGSPEIESEFLLLGILREEKYAVIRWVGEGDWQAILREEVAKRVYTGPKTSTSVDLPLSSEAKRVLAYAAEEADRLRHQYIGVEHLFLGLLREPSSRIGKVLIARGLDANAVRETVARESKQGRGISGSESRYVVPQRHPVQVQIIPEKGDQPVQLEWTQRIPVVGEFLSLDDDIGRSIHYQVVRVEWKVSTHPIETPFLSRVLIHVQEFTSG